ncbi:MAG: alpha/beta hydrolase [Fibrobacteria bacterium]
MSNKAAASFLLALSFNLPSSLFAQGSPELLWADVVAGRSGDSANFKPTLLSYPVSGPKANGSAVLICPGGGYVDLAYTYEGIDVAKKFNSYGVSAFVVKYRRSPGFMYPVPIDDGRRAMRMIRSRARQLNIDTNRIGIMGFSAGGHLASTILTHYDLGDQLAKDTVDRMSCKPAFAILVYPVISMRSGITHTGSRDALLGKPADTALVTFLSNELQVKPTTPPTFLVHAKDDPTVPYANSQLFYDACIKSKVTARLLPFTHGPHGFGLANGSDGASNIPEISVWPDSCAKWLEVNGFFKVSTSTFLRSALTQPRKSTKGLRHGRIILSSDMLKPSSAHDFSGRTTEYFGKPNGL